MPTLFAPDAVAYICGCKPDVHNPGAGGDMSLFIGNYCRYSERFLLHWDLSGLPPGVKVSKAVMGLYCVEIHGTPSGRLIYAPVLSKWGDTVTYATQPEKDSQRQVVADWPAEGQWHEVEITDIVSRWLEKPEANYGLIGFAEDVVEDTCSAVFASIRDIPTSVRPKMTVVYG